MAQVTILPNAAGDNTNWPSTGGTSVHWVGVSDASDLTYVRNNTAVDQEDDYKLGASGLTTETVNTVDVRSRARSETVAVGAFVVGLRLGTINSLAGTHTAVSTTVGNFSDTNIARPGGGAWTVADIGTLQVVAIGNGGTTALRLFEILGVDINYTAAAGGVVGPGWKSLLGVGQI